MSSLRGPAPLRPAGVVAALSLAFVLLVLLVLVGRPLATDDLWWHLKLGEIYAQLGPFVDEDPLYHTTRGRPTVPHEWLFQVALHGAERGVGFQGLRLLHVGLVAAIALWALRIFRRAAGGLAPAALACIVFLELSWYRLFQLRPDLTSVLALLGLYTLLLEKERPPGAARIGAALVLFAVWVNLHSLFAIGLALLVASLLGIALRALLARGLARDAPGLAGTGPDPARRSERRLALALSTLLVLCALVTLANPRGWEAHALFFVESASGDIWHLEDDFLPWNPLWPAAERRALTPLCWLLADALLLAFVVTAGLALARLLRERSAAALRDLDAVHLGLAAASLVAMVVAVRFHWMSFFPLLYVLRALARHGAAAPAFAAGAARACAVASVPLALVFPSGIHLDSYAREVAVEVDGYRSAYLDQRYCGHGMRFLREAGIEGRLFHPFNLGGFLGYWLAPQLRTFIDGRMDHYPSEVLDDYLKIRRASQEGAPRVLRKLLDKWEIDVFFGTSFPEIRYSDRFWIAHLRRMPGWVPIFVSQTHSIYLRRTPRNQRNFTLAKAYYLQRRIPFDAERGVDVEALLRRRPAWALKQGVVPPYYEGLLGERESNDEGRRAAVLAELGRIYWQIGAFESQAEVDRELLLLEPASKEARRRLADAWLHLGRPAEALALARELHDEDPGYEDIAVILAIARQRAASGAAPTESTAPSLTSASETLTRSSSPPPSRTR
ncbi:MAG: hypothetical protein QNK04_24210 [Myxococcota bacterium]|nr:hypothetical protein [Myxococcota bacterium]